MSIEANQSQVGGATIEANQAFRRTEVGQAILFLADLTDPKQQPFNIHANDRDEMVRVTDVSNDLTVHATYLVERTFKAADTADDEPHVFLEKFAISAGFTALTGYSKIDMTAYDANESFYVELGIKKATEGLNDEDEALFMLARDEHVKLKQQRDEFPHSELSDAEQASTAATLNPSLNKIHREVVSPNQARYSSFAPV